MCTAFKTTKGLMNFLLASWTIGGTEAVTQILSGIQINTTPTTTMSTSTLTYNPLQTSHKKEYSCNRLLISTASRSVLNSTQRYRMVVQSKNTT